MSTFHTNLMDIAGVYQIQPFSASDQRGYVSKDYDKKALELAGIKFEPCESMIIESKKNVIRGMHFQFGEKQDKLVRCLTGEAWAAIVDLRANSKTIGKWISVEINNGSEVYIPGGCALGTLAIEDSIIMCAFGEAYDKSRDSGIIWNDENIGIRWPLNRLDGELILSEKDAALGDFADYKLKMGLG